MPADADPGGALTAEGPDVQGAASSGVEALSRLIAGPRGPDMDLDLEDLQVVAFDSFTQEMLPPVPPEPSGLAALEPAALWASAAEAGAGLQRAVERVLSEMVHGAAGLDTLAVRLSWRRQGAARPVPVARSSRAGASLAYVVLGACD